MALIGLIHSTRLVIEPVHKVVSAQCPGVEVLHVMDEGLLRALRQSDKITDQIAHWLAGMIRPLAEAGADLAVVTCSSLSPVVNAVRALVPLPVLKIDEPMVEWAVTTTEKIGVVMTNPSTVEPSTRLIQEVSQRLGKNVRVTLRVCQDAFSKLNRGDVEGHDAEVRAAITELLDDMDVVMLAQISIARVLDQLDEKMAPRVLSSLRFIAPKIQATLQQQG